MLKEGVMTLVVHVHGERGEGEDGTWEAVALYTRKPTVLAFQGTLSTCHCGATLKENPCTSYHQC